MRELYHTVLLFKEIIGRNTLQNIKFYFEIFIFIYAVLTLYKIIKFSIQIFIIIFHFLARRRVHRP